MSRPIRLTEDLMKKAIEEFRASLAGMKMSNGKVSYTKSFTYEEDEKAKILFDPLAYAKMLQLVVAFDTEVAWHGVGERLDDNVYRISDIVVYPQDVTTGTVEMDPAEYGKWEQKLILEHMDDERYLSFIMQGHSHVNGGTSPSDTDVKHQEAILSHMTEDSRNGVYIFLIWNKRFEHFSKIFDLKTNTLYEDKDIEYGIYADNFDMKAFLEDARGKVKKKVYQAYQQYGGQQWNRHQTYNGQSSYQYGAQNKTATGAAQQTMIPPAKPSESKVLTEAGNKKQKHKPGTSDFGSGYGGRGDKDMSDEAVGVLLRQKYGFED